MASQLASHGLIGSAASTVHAVKMGFSAVTKTSAGRVSWSGSRSTEKKHHLTAALNANPKLVSSNYCEGLLVSSCLITVLPHYSFNSLQLPKQYSNVHTARNKYMRADYDDGYVTFILFIFELYVDPPLPEKRARKAHISPKVIHVRYVVRVAVLG